MNRVPPNKYLGKIIPVRVSAEQWETIKKEAGRKGLGVSTLTRMWIMEYLGGLTDGKLKKKVRSSDG